MLIIPLVEYTPQAYVASDLDNFAKKYAAGNVGKRPTLTSIDGGFVQTDQTSFDYNGESNLDLEYGMALVTDKQPVTLYQVGDAVEGKLSCASRARSILIDLCT